MMSHPDAYSIPVYRLQLKEEGTMRSLRIRWSTDVRDQCLELASSDREELVCLYLNTKNRPIGRQTVSIGDLNSTIGHPREIFKAALLCNADSVVLVHNHPSGDPKPSKADDRLTFRVASAGAMIGVGLLDHVIVTASGAYFSYKDSRPALLGGSWAGDDADIHDAPGAWWSHMPALVINGR